MRKLLMVGFLMFALPVQAQVEEQYAQNRSRFTPAQQGAGYAAPQDAASFEVRMTQLEEVIRRQNGTIEELQFRLNSLQNSQRQYEDQMDRKVGLIEQKVAGAPASTPTPHVASTPAATPSSTPAQSTPATAPAAGTPNTPGNARDHYNQAFQLLNQANFKDARVLLDSFVQKYPQDALVGNAYYWLGETYYVERNYVTAADNFRKGYEVMPNGPKAPDNLLKLGMALLAMGKQPEACVVYDQIFLQFPNAGNSVRQKVEQERSQAQCKKRS